MENSLLQEFDFILEYAKIEQEIYDYKQIEYLEIIRKEREERELLKEIQNEF